MPLPVNGSLLLQGHSRPGETLHSKPKQAIIVRMSEETLEALEAFPQHPQMDFEFGQNGENAGIYIGDTYFPMRPLAEGSTHDLYLRATSASRPMAPLKLYAHVTGKLAVERELGERIQDRIRESTKDAVKQRSERTTILLDNPPEISHPKKRGAAPPARKHPRPSDHIRNAAQPATSTPVARVGSPAPSLTKSGGASVPVRKRLVQCLAVSEKSPDEVVRLIGGAGCDPSTRRDLLGLLDEVAEPVPGAKKTSSQPWRLKNTTWLDVRPYEWQKLTETQRSNMSVAARRAFTSLGLPANHLAWERLSRPSGTGITDPYTPSPAGPSRIASAAGASAVVAPKRGLSSREVKDKKAKPKTDSKEIMMKDESVRVPSRLSNVNGPADGGDSRSSSAAAKVAPRKPPGSGFRAGRASPSEFGSSAADDPARTRGKPTDVRVKDRGPSQPARSAPPIPPPAMQEKRPTAPAVPRE
ncbi:hypothetical protein BD779DRAFT_979856 [Infundibulicybe gibba]|nr:hypothetical protein BD779DRAFT_979856 [Infundibulicybe gibba]